jgi:molybdate transport system substrate-binding protein
LVYVSDAFAAGHSATTISIPAKLNTVNSYYIAPVKGSDVASLAQQWVSLVSSPTGQGVLRAAKFGRP